MFVFWGRDDFVFLFFVFLLTSPQHTVMFALYGNQFSLLIFCFHTCGAPSLQLLLVKGLLVLCSSDPWCFCVAEKQVRKQQGIALLTV